MSEQSITEKIFEEGDTLKANGFVLEATHISYQERIKEGTVTEENPSGEVERYNFTYSFRPHDDMERERAETTPPVEAEEVETASEENKPNGESEKAY